jgi:outer membrane protein TolC
MTKVVLLILLGALPIFAGLRNLSLHQALKILDKNNLEIKISQYESMMKYYDKKAVDAMRWGKADISITALRSNDAGNVFGFKLQSREANFADFGFSDFMGALGQGVMQSAMMNGGVPSFPLFAQGLAKNGDKILSIEPKDLNYPGARNHFLTKFTYMLPIYTGGKITEYQNITQGLFEMSQLDARKLRNEKIFQVKKTFHDITLVNDFIYSLRKIRRNMQYLKRTIVEMKKEGYTKNTDILEIDAKLAEVDSMLNQAKLNRELAYQFLSFLLNRKVSSIKRVRTHLKVPRVTKKDIERLSLDIQKAKLGLKISEHAVKAQKANFLPTVGGFAEYGSADDKLWNEFGKKDFYTVGIQVKMNLFNGGADKAKLEKARLQRLKVAQQVELAKKGIALQVKKIKSSIRSLSYRLRSARKQLRLAKEVYKTYEEKYKVGLASITDLLIKQSIELQVLMQYLQVANQRNTKILELQKILDFGGRR